jgi:hypothetical protein
MGSAAPGAALGDRRRATRCRGSCCGPGRASGSATSATPDAHCPAHPDTVMILVGEPQSLPFEEAKARPLERLLPLLRGEQDPAAAPRPAGGGAGAEPGRALGHAGPPEEGRPAAADPFGTPRGGAWTTSSSSRRRSTTSTTGRASSRNSAAGCARASAPRRSLSSCGTGRRFVAERRRVGVLRGPRPCPLAAGARGDRRVGHAGLGR